MVTCSTSYSGEPKFLSKQGNSFFIAACAYLTGARGRFGLESEPIHRRPTHWVRPLIQQRHPVQRLAAGVFISFQIFLQYSTGQPSIQALKYRHLLIL